MYAYSTRLLADCAVLHDIPGRPRASPSPDFTPGGRRDRTRGRKHLVRLGVTLLVAILLPSPARAEDADRFRPYLRFHSGDLSPQWGVDDLWSFGLGANFNRYLGAELALDFFERDFDVASYGTVGEVAAWNFVPELRLRRPLLRDRLVPYLIAGIGPSFLQLNDRKPAVFGKDTDIQGFTFAVTLGAGIEYFIADNVTFGLEGKYMWVNPITGTVDGQAVDVDVSSPAFTFGLRVYFDENRPRPLATAEHPAHGRLYFGVRVGGAVPTDTGWTDGAKLVPEPSSIGSVSQTGGLMLGADFGENWGLELSVDSLEYGIDLSGRGTVGEYGMGVALAQLRLQYPLGRGRWVPYFRVGGGAAYGEYNDMKERGAGLSIDAKGIYPAVGVGGGLDYFLTRNFALNADVRWLYTWGHDLNIGNTVNGSGDFAALGFTLGFRVYLVEF